MRNTKEEPVLEQVADSVSTNIDPAPPPELPPIIPDPTGIALLLFAIIGVSELGRATIRGKS